MKLLKAGQVDQIERDAQIIGQMYKFIQNARAAGDIKSVGRSSLIETISKYLHIEITPVEFDRIVRETQEFNWDVQEIASGNEVVE